MCWFLVTLNFRPSTFKADKVDDEGLILKLATPLRRTRTSCYRWSPGLCGKICSIWAMKVADKDGPKTMEGNYWVFDFGPIWMLSRFGVSEFFKLTFIGSKKSKKKKCGVIEQPNPSFGGGAQQKLSWNFQANTYIS